MPFDTIRMGASAAGAYEIERSLRFNSGDSANLTRTSSATSTTFTYSAWIKRSPGTDYEYIFSMGNRGFSFHKDNDTFYLYDGSNLNESTAKFRDPSAWYHIVVQINSGAATSYINNVQVHNAVGSGFTLTTGSNETRIGSHASGNFYYNGYMTEIHLVNGSVVAPSSFGETDSDTGQWIPKKYEGAHGTDGFYLNFSDNSNTTAGTLGADSSGNGNNFTPNNFSVSGAATDSFEDTPTNNFCTMNPLAGRKTVEVTPADGNLYTALSNAGTYQVVTATQAITSGKWYWEVTVTAVGSQCNLGVTSATWDQNDVPDEAWRNYQNNGNKNTATGGTNTGTSSWGATYTTGDVIGVAVDMSAGSITFYKNGSSQGAAYTDLASAIPADGWIPFAFGYNGCNLTWNFGQRAFAHTPPTGHKKLCTNNLPVPTIKDGTKHFNSLLWTGTGASNARTGLGFSPNFVWVKKRSASGNHSVFDTVRGANAELITNGQSAEATGDVQLVKSFDSDGFTLGTNSGVNGSGATFVGWAWKESASAGFDIVSYTGTGSARTVSHNLGVAPEMIIVKNRDTADKDWRVYHSGMGAANKYIGLNSLNAANTSNSVWNNTAPTSSVFSVADDGASNGSGNDLIAYVFASVEGYSKCGTYSGNGNADGVFVFTGFRPAFLLIKCTNSAESWEIYDNKREGYNVDNDILLPDLDDAEGTQDRVDLLSNGFKARINSGGLNGSSKDYIYYAIAERPFKYANAR